MSCQLDEEMKKVCMMWGSGVSRRLCSSRPGENCALPQWVGCGKGVSGHVRTPLRRALLCLPFETQGDRMTP